MASQNNLYILYANGGEGLSVNKIKAIHWLKKASENNSARAQANLSLLYFQGIDVEKDFFKAYALAAKSSKQNDYLGMFYLASYYNEGIGTSKNRKKTFELMQKVANSKEEMNYTIAEAQYKLGQMYYEGSGITKNWEYAYEWYLISYSNGYVQSKTKIKELENKLSKKQINNIQRRAKYWKSGGSSVVINDEELLKISRTQKAQRQWIKSSPWITANKILHPLIKTEYSKLLDKGWDPESKKFYKEIERQIINKKNLLIFPEVDKQKIKLKIDGKHKGYGQYLYITNKNPHWKITNLLVYYMQFTGKTFSESVKKSIGPNRTIRIFFNSEDSKPEKIWVKHAKGFRIQ